MRSLWRSTWSLFRKYPILWVPALLADFLAFTLIDWLAAPWQRHLRRWLLSQLAAGHSVLGGATDYIEPSRQAILKLQLFMAPLTWSVRLFDILFSAAAVVATAALLSMLAGSRRPALPATIPEIAASRRSILGYSLKLLGLNIIAILVMELASPFITALTPNIQSGVEKALSLSLRSSIELEKLNLIGNIFGRLWPLPLTLCVVYLISPLQARLTQTSGSILTPLQKKKARVAGILTALAGFFVAILVIPLEAGAFQYLGSQFSIGTYIVEAVAGLLRTLPSIPLYIALYLIANPDTPLTAPPTPQPAGDAPATDQAL